MNIKNKKILISGGTGQIGSFLCERLMGENHKVFALDNFYTGRRSNLSHQSKKNVKIIKIDVSNSKYLDRFFKGV